MTSLKMLTGKLDDMADLTGGKRRRPHDKRAAAELLVDS